MKPEAIDLIAVCCHGICRHGATAPGQVELPQSWVGSFPGEASLLVEHVHAAVALAATASGALLVFSGGCTRVATGTRSEAMSYLEIARDGRLPAWDEVNPRTAVEEYARDSFENLLCSIACFAQHTGRYPRRIEVVGWGFKAVRFEAHARALGVSSRFRYHEVNEPLDVVAARRGEDQKLAAVALDPWLTGRPFVAQREARDPLRRGRGYRGVDPTLDRFLDALELGDTGVPPPWEYR